MTTTGTSKDAHPPEELGDISLAQTLESLQVLDQTAAVLPEAARQSIIGNCTQMLDQAERLGLHTALDLLHHRDQLMDSLAPTFGLHGYRDLEAQHTHRNLLPVLLMSTAYGYELPMGPILKAVPKLAIRTHAVARALTDDEIALCRVRAVTLLRTSSWQRAVAYALCEAGMTPGETTTVRGTSLHGDERPDSVDAAGNRYIADRTLPLDDFGSYVPATRNGSSADLTRLLHYTGKHAGTSAGTAAAQTLLTSLLERARPQSRRHHRLWDLHLAGHDHLARKRRGRRRRPRRTPSRGHRAAPEPAPRLQRA